PRAPATANAIACNRLRRHLRGTTLFHELHSASQLLPIGRAFAGARTSRAVSWSHDPDHTRRAPPARRSCRPGATTPPEDLPAMDPLDPFNIGWQKRLKDVERVIDTGVGMGLGVSKSLLGNEISTALTGQFGAGGATMPMTPAQGLQNIMHTVADQFLDKRIRVGAGTGTLTMTPTDLETHVNSLDLARGQFARIQAAATD